MSEFFLLSFQLSDRGVLMGQKTCLLMAAAASLEICRSSDHTEQQLTLPSGMSEVQSCVLEEVWGYYEEALSIIATTPEDFPELEILWLLTRGWNTGILLYSLAQYPEAERWCRLGMSFLKHLGSLQDSYQTPSGAQAASFVTSVGGLIRAAGWLQLCGWQVCTVRCWTGWIKQRIISLLKNE